MGIFSKKDKEPGGALPDTSGNTNNYLYSYSGADAKPFCWFDEAPELTSNLVSLHTISVSIHEAKGQARALGYRGIKGLSLGVRTIAGSMILTVVNDHPLYPLISQYNTMVAFRSQSRGVRDGGDSGFEDLESLYNRGEAGWSIDRNMNGVGTLNGLRYDNRLSTLLPGFNLAMVYVTEQARTNEAGQPESAGWLLRGVEFITEGQVTSVNDIVTEMTFQFIACDFKPFSFTNRFDGANPEELANDLTSQEFTQNSEKEMALRTRLLGDSGRPGRAVSENPDYKTSFGSPFPVNERGGYDFQRGGRSEDS